MYNGKFKNTLNIKNTLEELAGLIIRGGWPSNINVAKDKIGIIPKSYINAILDKDITDDKNRDKNKMRMLLKSLARNESSLVSNKTLLRDIEEYENSDNIIESRITTADYLDVLNRLHIIKYQNPYSENYRSPSRVGKAAKIHFIDPSLACSMLDLTIPKLIDDLNTFGLMFESLVQRDLRIYIECLNGNIYHFRDNVTGLEVDSILEFENGDYAAIEIKLGFNQVEKAKENLIRFSQNMDKKPKFMCIVVGYTDIIAKDPNTGIYIVPITALKPEQLTINKIYILDLFNFIKKEKQVKYLSYLFFFLK